MSDDATLVTRMKLEAELANVQTVCAYLQLERDNIAVQRDTALAKLSVIRAERDALRAILRAILEADERGQGQPFAEAMERAHVALGRSPAPPAQPTASFEARVAEVTGILAEYRPGMTGLETQRIHERVRVSLLAVVSDAPPSPALPANVAASEARGRSHE